MTTGDFATRLLAWYRRHARRLPWRSRRDPWATWVSEVMLQQTRVEVVIPAFERFLAPLYELDDFAVHEVNAGNDHFETGRPGIPFRSRYSFKSATV